MKIRPYQLILSFLYLAHSVQLFYLASYYEKPFSVPFYEDPLPFYRYGAVLSFFSFVALLFIHKIKLLAVIPILRALHGVAAGLLFNVTSLAVFFIDVINLQMIFTKNTFLEFLGVWPMVLFVVTIVRLILFTRSKRVESSKLSNE